jgi:GNAT superfamily N-acetyltransferase
MPPVTIRPATLADAPAMADAVAEGFESYREWAPGGWDPPDRAFQLAGIRNRLPTAGCVCLLAELPAADDAARPAPLGDAAPAAPAAPPGDAAPAAPAAPPGDAAAPALVVAGQVAYAPVREEPGVAHVWMLFVRRAHWGTGIASQLLERAVQAATHEGYRGMRLHTPAEHLRARAFYEREGWASSVPPFYEPMLGLTLVTYRRDL